MKNKAIFYHLEIGVDDDSVWINQDRGCDAQDSILIGLDQLQGVIDVLRDIHAALLDPDSQVE